MARPLAKYNGKMSIKVSTFTRSGVLLYAEKFGTTAQGAIERLVKERVEADNLADAVALRALEMVQAVTTPGGE